MTSWNCLASFWRQTLRSNEILESNGCHLPLHCYVNVFLISKSLQLFLQDAKANPGLLTATSKVQVDESTTKEEKKEQRRKKASGKIISHKPVHSVRSHGINEYEYELVYLTKCWNIYVNVNKKKHTQTKIRYYQVI